MSFQKFRSECEAAVKNYSTALEEPPKEIDADLAMPCFGLAKKLKKNPAEIASDIVKKIDAKNSGVLIKRVEAAGPYVNFYADWNKLGNWFEGE